MSAILSADDLNDFISPGVACIKPVETLPLQKPQDNPYEVTTEDKLPPENLPPAQISLTDCLACSGCVTSAEAVLVSLQSHTEVLNALDSQPSIPTAILLESQYTIGGESIDSDSARIRDSKIFVASVSPQVRASVAATYGVSERKAGWMIEQLLSGPNGLRTGGAYGNGFTWVVDTNAMREACLVVGADEVMNSMLVPEDQQASTGEGVLSTQPKKPILTSACPGWICYAEKTHPHILPHLSRLKSPQALTGTMLKTVLSRRLHITPDRIWHVAIMPCFDKKLEASREELTDIYWQPPSSEQASRSTAPVRDVDCVITARELFMLADTRGISFPSLPRRPLDSTFRTPFPDPKLEEFLFPQYQAPNLNTSADRKRDHQRHRNQSSIAGTSGGYLYHILQTYQSLHPGSSIHTERGRNADVVDYTLVRGDEILFRAARYYGFRNIQNLVRKLRPARKSRLPGGKMAGSRRPGQAKGGGEKENDYAYVEVMACPGGCTNGGGQVKVEDVGGLKGAGREEEQRVGVQGGQKEWLARVDEAYFSMDESDDEEEMSRRGGDGDEGVDGCEEGVPADVVNGISTPHIKGILDHWAHSTGIELHKLVFTSYRKVESDVGKDKVGDTERVVELAGRLGGGCAISEERQAQVGETQLNILTPSLKSDEAAKGICSQAADEVTGRLLVGRIRAATGPSITPSINPNQASTETHYIEMPTLLGKEVGATGYGLMGLTRPPKPCSQEQAFTAMRTALSHGANCWNGGEFYGTPEYNSLHLLSRYFEKYPADAEKVVLNIKGGLGPNMVPDGSEKGVRRSVDASLAMLEGKKKLDIFECARVDPKTPIEASMEVLATYVKEGKLGGIGLSEVRAETIRRAHKVHPICSVEVELSLWATEILTNGVAATCAELSIPVLAYSPLGRGFLTGEIRSKADLPDGDIRHRMPRFQDDVFDKNLKLVDELQKLAKKKNCTGAQLALAWVKHLSGAEGMPVIIPIPGATTEERVVENMKDVTLDNADMDEINEILGKAEIHGARYPPAFQHLLDG